MKLKQFVTNFLEFLKGVPPVLLGVILETLPMVLHTCIALMENEKEGIPIWVTFPISLLTAIAFEFLILLLVIRSTKNNIRLSWALFVVQIFINILYYGKVVDNTFYFSSNIVTYLLALIIPTGILIYSHLVAEGEKEKQEKSNLVTIVENTQAIVEQVQEVKKKINRFPKRTKEEIAMNIPKNKIRAYRSGKYTPVLNAEGKVEDNKQKTKIIV